jgi:protoporphyrinogen oxidase
MSSNKEIESLIKKYENGDTSLQDEAQLKAFFSGENIPEHLKVHTEWFKHLKVSAQVEWQGFTEDKMFQKLNAQISTESKVIPINKGRNRQVWVLRIAAAVALILVGYYAGADFQNNDVSEMKQELAQLKARMFEQMNSNSASGRLQAVNYSLEFDNADEEILDALVLILVNDKNMNVRLKAVEALSKFEGQKTAQKAILTALKYEKEPMVQIALIETVVANKETGALEDLEKIARNENSLKAVKDEAYMALFKLREL